MATCALCNDEILDDEVLDHLRLFHDVDTEPARWPDGDVVIVDQTLKPEDFG